MKRQFKLENLPKDVREKIDTIVFASEGEFVDDETLGECNLKDGYVIDGMYHWFTFNSRQELIDDIRENVEVE